MDTEGTCMFKWIHANDVHRLLSGQMLDLCQRCYKVLVSCLRTSFGGTENQTVKFEDDYSTHRAIMPLIGLGLDDPMSFC